MPYLKANHLLLKNTVMSFQLGWPSEIKEKSTQWAGLQMRNLSPHRENDNKITNWSNCKSSYQKKKKVLINT